ncbi:MAG: GNAT family N-acetyltransferase [Rubrivivax sp.]
MVASDSLPSCRVDADADAAAALALSDAAGWNQTAQDWALFSRHGQVLGRRDDTYGELVATAAALPYGGAQGWISMVLVHKDWRHRGLASALMGESVAWLRGAGITPILDATPAGQAVYRRLGFEPGMAFERWQRSPTPAPTRGPHDAGVTRVAGSADLPALTALDAAASGVHRSFLIEAFLARGDTRAWMLRDGSGFVLARAGRRAVQVGPLVATDTAGALALLGAALATLPGAVFVDAVTRHTQLAAWLHAHGFSSQRPFVRMALGDAAALHGGAGQYLVAGPEFG